MNTALDSNLLRKRLHELNLRCAQLEGMKNADLSLFKQTESDVAAAKGRALLQDEISLIFDALQHKAHERSVGAFERLLSAILKDVLPEEGSVRLLPQFKANGTWLDVALEKNNQLEDVVSGNGGAVTNVVCAGLRYAALLRTKNRKFMVLDEPDCWIKPDKVPAFIQVISEVAKQTQTQTIFVTHHDIQLLEGKVNIVKLFQSDAKKDLIEAKALAPLVFNWENKEQPGIRAIELFNFRRHTHTFIPCFPGATAYIGDNNLGKSTALVSSFKAVAYGESDDTMIKHGCEEAKINIYLENDLRIEWTRSLKKSPSVMYRLYNNTSASPIKEGRPKSRNQSPDWVCELLGITRVDDLDIQVGNQKDPVFLLNDSAPKRAQILSVGKESGHLKSLMKKYEERKSLDREVIRHGEAQVTRLNYRLTRMSDLSGLTEKLHSLMSESDLILKNLQITEQLEKCISKLEAVSYKTESAVKKLKSFEDIPVVPALESLDKLFEIVTRIEKSEKRTQIKELKPIPTVPEFYDISKILTIGQKLSKITTKLKDIKEPLSLPNLPVLSELNPLQSLINLLDSRHNKVMANEVSFKKVSSETIEKEKHIEDLRKSFGSECPLCGSNLVHQHD